MTSIMDDIQDAFNKVGLFQKEVKVQTPVGTRTFYEDIDEDEEEEDEEEEEGFKQTPTHPDYSQPASLNFDGQNLSWQQNGEPVKYWSATSGQPQYQSSQYTNMVNKGPIPEGNWILKKNSGEYYEPGEGRSFDEIISGTGIWKTNPSAWGNSRIPIEPQQNTNTFGRTNMYVHGGTTPGSAGCIDLTRGMDNFYNDFKNYDGDIPLEVKYPKDW